ncbi:MAG TPA: HrcA family transcriptional regulator, partial [Gemmatimonadaceae bacterium]
YRSYVDALLAHAAMPATAERDRLAEQIATGAVHPGGSPIESILRRAAQALGVLTQELGLALGPRLGLSVLLRLDLVRMSSDRLLLVLTLEGGVMRTVFVEVPSDIADIALTEVTTVLNERLAGLTLEQIRTSLPERVRDTTASAASSELLNIFVQEAEQLFEAGITLSESPVVLGQPSLLAEQPEFSGADRMRRLIELTERPQVLVDAIRKRGDTPGVSITIGSEHTDPRLDEFTVVTAEYKAGTLTGVIGVIGPTRMPYDKVISLVTHTSRLLTDLLD